MDRGTEKFGATTYIRKKLLNSPEIKELVGDKIFPVIAPAKTNGDYVIIYRKSYGKKRDKQGVYSVYCSVGVEIYTNNYDRGIKIAKAIDKCLDDGADNFGIEPSTPLVGSIEDYVDGKYYQELEYSIT